MLYDLDMVLSALVWFSTPCAWSADPPVAAPTEAPRSRRGLTPGKVRALAFVPFPGFPSLVQGDLPEAGLSLALTAPMATWWVVAADRTAKWEEERWAVSIGGAYAVTVVVNQITGMRSFRRHSPTVSVSPRPGGAMVTVHAAW